MFSTDVRPMHVGTVQQIKKQESALCDSNIFKVHLTDFHFWVNP